MDAPDARLRQRHTQPRPGINLITQPKPDRHDTTKTPHTNAATKPMTTTDTTSTPISL